MPSSRPCAMEMMEVISQASDASLDRSVVGMLDGC